MYDQQKVEKFWAKLDKSCIELQHDFAKLDPQDKQTIERKVNNILAMQGITVRVDSLISVMKGLGR